MFSLYSINNSTSLMLRRKNLLGVIIFKSESSAHLYMSGLGLIEFCISELIVVNLWTTNCLVKAQLYSSII